MYDQVSINQDASGQRMAVVVSRYHETVTDALREAAIAAFLDAGGRAEDLVVIPAPGAFELTAICAAAARRGGIDAIVALGCVITGETTHDRHIADSIVQGLTRIIVETGVPVAFGVLTCGTMDLARARAGGRVGNKGTEAMAAAIETVNTIRSLGAPRGPGRARLDMSRKRDIRRCALQVLYQFDAGNGDDTDLVRESLEGSPGAEDVHEAGFALATETWAHHTEADAAVSALTPQWPTHRQPVVDRNLLRLAWWEMTSGRTPPKVVINEAVELAKEFSTEKSPMFINGVLDKLYLALRETLEPIAPEPADEAT